MTSTRRENDAYYTPDDVAKLCVYGLSNVIDPTTIRTVVEPSVGGGAFIRAWKEIGLQDTEYDAFDIDPFAVGLTGQRVMGSHLDFLQWVGPPRKYDLVLGNPPYSDALRHVQKALEVGQNVAFLLRLGFLASVRRKDFFQCRPPAYVFVLSKRPSFTEDGKTDGQEYAFFVWKEHSFKTNLAWI